MLSVSAEGGADKLTQEETDILVWEVHFIYITDKEQCAHNITDVVLKAKTFKINLGASHLQTSQVTLDLLWHGNSDHARNSAFS